MGPATRSAYESGDEVLRVILDKAAHVLIDFELWDRVKEIALALPSDGVLEGALPNHTTVVEVTGRLALLFVNIDGLISVELLRCSDREIDSVCGPVSVYSQRTPDLTVVEEFVEKVMAIPDPEANREAGESLGCILTETADLLFSFMAEPRFITQRKVSKLKRSMSAKKMGTPALRHTWVKLGWTIGKSVRQKGSVAGSAPQKAFHMVRAHWREYDRETPKSERRKHVSGWWVWIEAHYAGNPGLGEVKHHYVPKLEDPGASSKVVHGIVASRIASSTMGHGQLSPDWGLTVYH